jgi:hypothetical protein
MRLRGEGTHVISRWSHYLTSQVAMDTEDTIGAAEFKAHRLEIPDRLSTRAVTRVAITERGRPVAVLTRPEDERDAGRDIHGFLPGSVVAPEGTDLTASISAEPFDAASGRLHR